MGMFDLITIRFSTGVFSSHGNFKLVNLTVKEFLTIYFDDTET